MEERGDFMNENLLKVALSQYGVQETVGGMHNATIVNFFKEIGQDWVKDDETAWCSAFVNWVALNCCAEKTGKLNARSWLEIGEHVTDPIPGDVIVLWRSSPDSWKGHVGFFINYDEDGKTVNVLGGNQGNSVSISGYDKGRILAFKRLRKAE